MPRRRPPVRKLVRSRKKPPGSGNLLWDRETINPLELPEIRGRKAVPGDYVRVCRRVRDTPGRHMDERMYKDYGVGLLESLPRGARPYMKVLVSHTFSPFSGIMKRYVRKRGRLVDCRERLDPDKFRVYPIDARFLPRLREGPLPEWISSEKKQACKRR